MNGCIKALKDIFISIAVYLIQIVFNGNNHKKIIDYNFQDISMPFSIVSFYRSNDQNGSC